VIELGSEEVKTGRCDGVRRGVGGFGK